MALTVDGLRDFLRRYTSAAVPAAATSADDALRELSSMCQASSQSPQPRTYFTFETMPPSVELAPGSVGETSYSIWMLLRLSASAAPPQNGELLCTLVGGSQRVEVALRDGGVVSVATTNAKGGHAAVQAALLLQRGVWHVLMIEHAAPPRRMLPFSRSVGGGTLRIYVDGGVAFEGALEFPAPSSALRHCHVGAAASSSAGQLCGDVAELCLLAGLSGGDAACDAMSHLRVEPRITLHEAVLRCGLRPSFHLHPCVTSLDQTANGCEPVNESEPRRMRVVRSFDVCDSLASVGGVRVPLLLIGRLQVAAPRAASQAELQPSASATQLAGLLRILHAVLHRRPGMQMQMLQYDGPAVLAWLLL